jgi:hypothetical protein
MSDPSLDAHPPIVTIDDVLKGNASFREFGRATPIVFGERSVRVGDLEWVMFGDPSSEPIGLCSDATYYELLDGTPVGVTVLQKISISSVDADFLAARTFLAEAIARGATFGQVAEVRIVAIGEDAAGATQMWRYLTTAEEARRLTIDHLGALEMIGAGFIEHLPGPTLLYLERSAEWQRVGEGWFRRHYSYEYSYEY